MTVIALTMEVICTSETPVNFHQTTRRNIQEYCRLHTRRRENLKSQQVKNRLNSENTSYNSFQSYVFPSPTLSRKDFMSHRKLSFYPLYYMVV
jgi:hypothetical protein